MNCLYLQLLLFKQIRNLININNTEHHIFYNSFFLLTLKLQLKLSRFIDLSPFIAFGTLLFLLLFQLQYHKNYKINIFEFLTSCNNCYYLKFFKHLQKFVNFLRNN